MSEPIPEAVPTSQDPRSKRPLKRRALTPVTQQASHVEALFAKPDREISVPTGPVTKKGLAPPPEIVANVQGSSAGAGSGEFHVYKASRRREYERIKLMEEEVAKEEADAEFEKKREEMKKKDEEKTGKNRKRREKKRKGKDGKEGAKDEVEHGAINSQQGRRPPLDLKLSGDVDEADAPIPAVEEVGVVIHDDD